MAKSAYIAGVGMTSFTKPGTNEPFPVMAKQAISEALAHAGLDFSVVQQAYAGYVYGDTTCGQRAVYTAGITGIPIINVTNACATGSTALFLARQAVESGVVDCALALGFEQMPAGAIDVIYPQWPSPWQPSLEAAQRVQGESAAPFACQLFGGAGREYMDRTGMAAETMAEVQVKARRHAANNDRALFRKPVTVEEVMASPAMFGPLTRLMCCPPTCGAAAAIVVSEDFARRHGLNRAVRVRAQAMVSDQPDVFEAGSMMKLVGYDMAHTASRRVYEAAGVDPKDIPVVELHDCFASNEIIAYDSLGLIDSGDAERFVRDGDNTYGGRCVTNPSGGLLSKGHPLGATGLAQCAELVWQMRGEAGARQVEGAKLALQHNLGLAGVCVISLYEAPAAA